jgi:kanamycin nucleotidyltransferase
MCVKWVVDTSSWDFADMLKVRLSADAPPGRSHAERLTAAHSIMQGAIAKHGAVILCVGVYGTTAIGLDGPYSDLDITLITGIDIGHESAISTRDGLLLNVDYQTWDESVKEANDPLLAGTWADFLVLYDPDNMVPALQAIANAVTEEEYMRAFSEKISDDVASAINKIRNAVLAGDRAYFLWACQIYSEAVCRAICLRNRRYVTGRARLREMTKQMPIVPDGFDTLIDAVSGAQPATDQEVYDAAEVLWAGIGSIPRSRN